MNTKKIIALVLVLALAVVLCVSCAREEEKTEETTAGITVTVINRTGETVTKIRLAEKSGSREQEWNMGGMADGQETTMTIDAAVENGAVNIDFSFVTESGQGYQTAITGTGDKTIIMQLDPEGGATAEISSR